MQTGPQRLGPVRSRVAENAIYKNNNEMRISELHVGQTVLLDGEPHVIETIDGRFDTVTLDGITAKAENLQPLAEPASSVTLSDWSELNLVENMLEDWLLRNGAKDKSYAAARKLQRRVIPALQKATEEVGL